MSVFGDDAIRAREERAGRALASQVTDEVLVVIASGGPIHIPGGQDQTYPFVPFPDYYWLTGSRRSGGAATFDPDRGWTHYVRPVTAAERLWEGDPVAPKGDDVAALDALLERESRPVVWIGPGQPSGLGTPSPEQVAAVQQALDAERRRKDDEEIALIERAAAATAAGHARAADVIAPGVTERTVQIELEAEMFRHGADATGYGTIVGTGTNAAVLHFSPSERAIAADDLVLADAGGSIQGYTADVTRTFAATHFDERRQAIYDLVEAALDAGIDACRPGTEWHDVHRIAARTMAAGLIELGLLRGDADACLESGAIARFFPHGVGHMVGLGVRDVGGRAPGREPARRSCGAVVRVDLPLEPGFVMTVEPGLYFVPALLDDAGARAELADHIVWDEVDRWRDVGGVRLEDDVLVTEGAPRNLTAAIPR